ncbi:endolytic transglycosylase MltG [Oceanospirillum sediminis]|uniref:Endolytic murein transglycosylase n=1 Tax=Oceanospirillum sediminis TaxID=2760088 RepID=A0A839ISL7_9GAMM|nr:endolytic transglycosylase MltG [Oceanospirillum sediminis]MBB1487469.1 endolytic transglycosylase MltG [Oceanospirillum sediminis]
MAFFYKRSVLILLSVLLFLAVSALAGFLYWKKMLAAPLPIQNSVIFELQKGAGVNQALRALKREGILEHRWPLRLWLKLYPQKYVLRAGEYRIPKGINAHALLDILTSGKPVQYQITLPEGLSFKEVLALLQQQAKLDVRTHDMKTGDIMQAAAGKDYRDLHPEGQFFPDTYQFHKGVTDLHILKTAYSKMQQVLKEEWDQADQKKLPYKSAYDALIMASIVEKETGVPDERARIAGVFVTRLQKKMRLQTDPTVIYGLGERFKGNLTRTHLKEKTAYNTYRINGLPPTPIAMPGRGAIHAALNPEKDGSLYFVAKGDGSHVFSRTLAAHNRAVREYQIYKRKQNYQSSPDRAEQ